ncbi:Phage antirepressor protein [Actinosynnema pretiosum subsp. pretiosum]|nr:Phage antirepressor protein [Actinosynnema pretiosum subsp. pretiosum]
MISEAGLYRLIMRSNAAGAEEFQEWLTAEVLPTIRRTGAYSVGHAVPLALPRTYAEALRELAATVERAEAAEAVKAVLEPLAEAWDSLASSGTDYSAREAAAILGRAGIATGQNRLLDTLRDLGMVDGRGRPYARHSRHLRLKPVSFENPRTGVRIPGKPQTRITVEGLGYLHRKLGGKQPLEIEAGS